MLKTSPAFSMFIAIAIITAMSIVSLSLTDIIINSITRTTEIQESAQSFYSAKAATELGKYQLKNMGPGYDTASESIPNTYQITPSSTASWYIKGSLDGTVSVDGEDGYHVVPRKGTGNAYDNCKTLTDYEDWMHPCNWQKLYPGQSVAIPLYIKGKDGTIYNPNDLDLDKIRVVVRTPCINGSDENGNCLDEDEDPSGNRHIVSEDFDDTIVVNWLIYGKCDGTNYTKVSDCSAYAYKEVYDSGETNEENDSRIKGVDINYYDINLYTYSLNQDLIVNLNNLTTKKLINFLRSDSYSIDKPILQIESIGKIYSDLESYIPYLEYQIQFYSNSNDKGYPNISERVYSSGNTNQFTYSESSDKEIQTIINSYAVSF